MMHQSFNPAEIRLSKDYANRLRSLLADGYILRHETTFSGITLAVMRHQFNRSTIMLRKDTIDLKLSQWTNGKLVHTQYF